MQKNIIKHKVLKKKSTEEISLLNKFSACMPLKAQRFPIIYAKPLSNGLINIS